MSETATKYAGAHIIKGSEKHKPPSYLVVGRRGGNLLAVKFVGVTPGPVTDSMMISLKLRAQAEGDVFAEQDAKSNVVAFVPKIDADKAWTLEWHRKDPERCSGIVANVLRGNPMTDPEFIPSLLAGNRLANKLTAYIEHITGDSLVLDLEIVSEWFQDKLHKHLGHIAERAKMEADAKKARESFQSEISEAIGSDPLGMILDTDALKKKFLSLSPAEPKITMGDTSALGDEPDTDAGDEEHED